MLEDVPALNRALRLTGPKHLVPFSAIHVRMMTFDAFEQGYLDAIPNYELVVDGYSRIGYSYTGVVEGKPVCSFGVIPLWPGVAEMWMLPDLTLRHHAFAFHRATKRWIDIVMSELCLVRLQCTVHTRNVRADKWIRSLYFESEGTLRRFGPEGADYEMYARLIDGRPAQLSESSPTAAGP